MSFQPSVHELLTIEDLTYTVAEHPRAPGIPYGQEGRAAVVYQLVAGQEKRALKVFKPRYRAPSLAGLSKRLVPLAEMPGLRVCNRLVLTPQQQGLLLRQHTDLTYSVLMPWIEGPTWMGTVLRKRELTPQECLALAKGLAGVLSGMEQEGIAHCDLSGPNVLLPMLSTDVDARLTSAVELVDVEQMFGAELKRPELLPAGSLGYAHSRSSEGLWSSDADRFAGALLIVEMLGWCDPRIRQAAWGESYFDPAEMQQKGARYNLLLGVLQARWGQAVENQFQRAWAGDTLMDCPTFGEWLVAIPDALPTNQPVPGQIGVRLNGRRPIRQLFLASVYAVNSEDWAEARELLQEVVSRDSHYTHSGHSAMTLLAYVNRHFAGIGRS